MKVLQLCHKIPFPPHDGGAISLYNNAMGLSELGIDVKVLAMETPKDRVKPQQIPPDFRRAIKFESFPVNTDVSFFPALRNLFSSQSYFVERFWSKEWNDHLIQILKSENFAIVQLGHSYLCLYIKTIRKFSHAKIVLRPQNAEHQVWNRILHNENNLLKKYYLKINAKKLTLFEKEVARIVDGIITIGENDAAIFRSFAPNIPVETIYFGFDPQDLPDSTAGHQQRERPVFYHLGSMDWTPNLQGINWFIKKVMPFVIKQNPGFRFRIAGKNMPDHFFQMHNKHLQVEGTIPNASAYHKKNDVMIVPLLSGGGIRVKIIEAMAMGKTVISTTTGAEGIPYKDGFDILIADSKEDFARQIEKCIGSKNFTQEIGQNARSLFNKHFNIRQTSRQMINFYHTLL